MYSPNKGLQFKLYRYITSSCKILTDEALLAKPADADWTNAITLLMSLTLFENATVKQKETKLI